MTAKLAFLLRYLLFFRAAVAVVAKELSALKDIRIIPHVNATDCALLCNLDKYCASWSYPQQSSNCYHVSPQFHKVLSPFNSPDEVGYLHPALQPSREVSIERLVAGPFATEATTMLNFQVHLLHGCSYTIAFWFWLWKPRNKRGYENTLFSTRAIHPIIASNDPGGLEPAVLYNAGYLAEHFDKLFLSANKDSYGQYSGLWPRQKIRYHEWTHVTVTFSHSMMQIFLNGMFVEYVHLDKAGRTCPYNDPNNRLPLHSFVNNTILQIMGSKHSLSTAGMIQDFVFVRNHAVSLSQVKTLMYFNKPKDMPLLTQMMKHFGQYSLQDYTVLDWENHPYRQLAWGLQCPTAVCGEVCLDEAFLLGLGAARSFSVRTSATAPQITVEEVNRQRKEAIKEYNADLKMHEATVTSNIPDEVKHYYDDEVPHVESEESIYEYSYYDADQYHDVELSEVSINAMSDDEAEDFLQQLMQDDPYLADDLIDHLYETMGIEPPPMTTSVGGGRSDGAVRTDGDLYGNLDEEYYYAVEDENVMKEMDRIGNLPPKDVLHVLRKMRVSDLNQDDASKAKPSRLSDKNKGIKKSDVVAAVKPTSHQPSPSPSYSPSPSPSPSPIPEPAATETTSSVRSSYDYYKLLPRSLASNLNQSVNGAVSNGSSDPSTSRRKSYEKSWFFNAHMKELYDSIRQKTNPGSSGEMDKFAASGLDAILRKQKRILALTRYGMRQQDALHIEELYDAAVLWLSGRHHLAFKVNAPITNEPQIADAHAFRHWRTQASDKFFATTALAMWLAHDLYDPRIDHDVDWNFRYPSTLSQPLHVLLGAYYGSDRSGDICVPSVNELELSWQTGKASASYMQRLREKLAQNHTSAPEIDTKPARLMAVNMTYWLQFLHAQIETGFFVDESDESLKPIFASNEANVRLYRRVMMEHRSRHSAGAAVGASEAFDKLHLKQHLALKTTPPNGIASGNGNENECVIGNSYYFSVAQYVASHMGLDGASVSLLEENRLRFDSFAGFYGEEDDYEAFTETDALAGHEGAQLWLGRRYLWGLGGVRQNLQVARNWFERAAERGNPEGLFNVGIMHLNGQGGLPVNQEAAFNNFQQAANNPFYPYPVALNALGIMHSTPNSKYYNMTLARQLYEQAAALGNPEAHFSMALLLNTQKPRKPEDVPLCVLHLAKAASQGHTRALGYLSHAVYDPESWLHQYIRERALEVQTQVTSHWQRTRNGKLDGVHSVSGSESADGISLAQHIQTSAGFTKIDDGADVYSTDSDYNYSDGYYDGGDEEGSVGSGGGGAGGGGEEFVSIIRPTNRTELKVLTYDPTQPIAVYLAGRRVEMPPPFGGGDSCMFAHETLKYLSEFINRANQVNMAGLHSYLDGDAWRALDYYDEGSALGVGFSQDNAAFLYRELRNRLCKSPDNSTATTISYTNTNTNARALSFGSFHLLIERFSWILPSTERVELGKPSAKVKSPRPSALDSVFQQMPPDLCHRYFDRMEAWRMIQMANRGDAYGRREVAKAVLKGRYPYSTFDRSLAFDLLLLSSSSGDVESMYALGWIVYHGDPVWGIVGNKTAAKELFRNRWRLETISKGSVNNLVRPAVFAAFFALVYIACDETAVMLGLGELNQWAARTGQMLGVVGTFLFDLSAALLSMFRQTYLHESDANNRENMLILSLVGLLTLLAMWYNHRREHRRRMLTR